jgi:16S rRNA processing protein RimM
MNIGEVYKIGYISKTHGLKGEVTIIPEDFDAGLAEVKTIYIELNQQLVPHFIEHYSDSRIDKLFVKFEDVNTPEQAQALKGCSLYLPKTQRQKSGRGEFYDDEVLGFEVEDENLGFLGKIKEILQSGPNRLLVIDHLPKDVLIPLNGPFVKRINKTKKKFTVELPDGFLDI